MDHLNAGTIFFGLTFLLHLLFAVGVFRAARGLRRQGEELLFAPPVVWAIHTLLWGMFALYCLIHHSSLRAAKHE